MTPVAYVGSAAGGQLYWDGGREHGRWFPAVCTSEVYNAIRRGGVRMKGGFTMTDQWILSSSSDSRALEIVDGIGRWDGVGPHYSRRTPGSRTFTGVGQEIVLITRDLSACWAVVRQRTPSKRGSGSSRGRSGNTDKNARYVWRNMLFRRLGGALASELIRTAVCTTYREWVSRYGALPIEVMRTEIDPRKVLSRNPGYSYMMAGFHNKRVVRGKIYLDAPCPTLLAAGSCACCPGSLLQSRDEVAHGT